MFECVQICTVSDTLPTLQRPAAVPIAHTRPVWYRVQTGAACPASGRVAFALHGLRLASGAACAAVCRVHFVRVRWGLGSPPLGYMERAGGRAVDTSRRKNSKKAFFGVRAANTHPTFTNPNPSDCAILQKFQKIQKDPFRSLDCGIIS